MGSMQHVFLLALGEFNLEDYDLGGNKYDYFVLWMLLMLFLAFEVRVLLILTERALIGLFDNLYSRR